MSMRHLAAWSGALALLFHGVSFGWGDEGHKVIGLIAYRHLTPQARAVLDELLKLDGTTPTAEDFANRGYWADRYREAHRETAAWHYVNLELEAPDLEAACFHFPAIPKGQPASAGPSEDCIVNKIDQFSKELKDLKTPLPERLLALKFLVHFIGDLHQPLHAIDHADRGGNCVRIDPPMGHGRANLHAYWDMEAVESLGRSTNAIADTLDGQITPELERQWQKGDARSWVFESYELGKAHVYSLDSQPTCAEPGSVSLSEDYREQAKKDTAIQIERAALRLAYVLNTVLPAR